MRVLQEHQPATLSLIIESFRFEDENKYEYEIKLKVFGRLWSRKRHPGKLHLLFFTKKVSTVIYTEEG